MFARLFRASLHAAELMPGGIDGHCHLLPGVDDGAPDAATALAIVRAQHKAGLRGSVCTPHIMGSYAENTPAKLHAHFAAFQQLARQEVPGFTLRLAAEYMLDERFESHLADRETLLGWPAPQPVAGSPAEADAAARPHLLVELPQYMLPPGWADMLEAVLAAGLTPVLAHPERYHRLLECADLVTLHRRGVRFQGNIGALTGYYSEASRELALALKAQNLYSWWGSDAHTADIFSHTKLRP